MTTIEKPTWPGGGCTNDECDAASNSISVNSIREIERVYQTSDLSWWPVPEGVTHVCVTCGFLYWGTRAEGLEPPGDETDVREPTFTPQELDWEHDPTATPGENIHRLLLAAPEGASLQDLEAFALRYVRGGGPQLVRAQYDRLDDAEGEPLPTAFPASDFM